MPLLIKCLIGHVCCLLILPLAFQSAHASTIRRGLGPEPDSLHIHQAQGLSAINLLRDLREGLVTFDERGELAPGQAESWQVLDEGRRYRFTLRADSRWSNGDPLTAQDFVRAWHRAFTPRTAAATAGLLKDVRNATEVLNGSANVESLGIEAVEPHVLDIILEEPAPWVLEILAHPVSYPLHAASIDNAAEAPVNGAFVLSQWTPRASILLQRNPEFHAAGSVPADAVEYFPIEEPAAELSRYRAGELDITETIPAGRFAWLMENLPKQLRVHPYLGTFWLGLNMRHSELGGSRELRQALSLAVNREILAEKVLGAGELPGWSVVPPGISGYRAAKMSGSEMSQDEREQLALKIFKQAGFGRHEALLLELRYNTSGVHRRVAVAVAAMWKQVLGVNTQLVNEEWKVFVNNRKMGVVTEVFRGGWIADYADPASFLDLFVGEDSLNNTFYSEPAFDMLMESAKNASGASRMEILEKAEARLMEDMPVIPLYYYVSRHLVHPAVTGFTDNVRDIHLSRYLDVTKENP
jgi:ABC-type oligopeptide transport system substrate-binding subunit